MLSYKPTQRDQLISARPRRKSLGHLLNKPLKIMD